MKQPIIVLTGGKTPEHEVSLLSTKEVIQNLNLSKYQVIPVVISKDGLSWYRFSKTSFLKAALKFKFSHQDDHWLKQGIRLKSPQELHKISRFVLLVMHGRCGEDGQIQGLLEAFGFIYSGSGILSSALGMDKLLFRHLISNQGFQVPPYVAITRIKPLSPKQINQLGLPLIVKPNDQGSSVGMSVVSQKKQLTKAIKKAFAFSNTVLIDQFIKGVEVTCSILGNGPKAKALPLVEIIPQAEFFDYHAKYEDAKTKEICPARLNSRLTKSIQQLSLRAFHLLDCRDFARVDFIIKDNIPYILEINTIPGLTAASLFPKAAAATNITYPKLLDELISMMKRRQSAKL